jgi:hypothetical protein
VWAAGATGAGAVVSHGDGQTWRQTVVDGFPRSAVSTVQAVSPAEVWAGGTAGFIGGPPGRPVPPLLARFDGQTWSRVTVPADFGAVTSLASTPSGALGWASVARSQKWGPPGGAPLVPGPAFLAWNGQTFTEYGEPEVAGEGGSSMPRRRPRGHVRPTHPQIRLSLLPRAGRRKDRCAGTVSPSARPGHGCRRTARQA